MNTSRILSIFMFLSLAGAQVSAMEPTKQALSISFQWMKENCSNVITIAKNHPLYAAGLTAVGVTTTGTYFWLTKKDKVKQTEELSEKKQNAAKKFLANHKLSLGLGTAALITTGGLYAANSHGYLEGAKEKAQGLWNYVPSMTTVKSYVPSFGWKSGVTAAAVVGAGFGYKYLKSDAKKSEIKDTKTDTTVVTKKNNPSATGTFTRPGKANDAVTMVKKSTKEIALQYIAFLSNMKSNFLNNAKAQFEISFPS
ncbi:MAG: hypothetical protein WDZ41_02715 [Candidatus Babeliales bacterium]